MRRARPRSRLLGIGGVLAAVLADPSLAAERELEDETAPTSTEQIETPLQETFLKPARKAPMIPWIRQQLQKLPPFFADTELEARFRTYYLRQDRTDGSLSEAWAMGGSISYRSGWLAELFSLEAEGFTSQPIIAPKGRGGTLLLAPVQEGYTVLGLANAKLRYKGVVLTGYRQFLGLPFVNKRDNRMTPQSFEALTLAKDEGPLRFSTGYIWNIRLRNGEEFISMAEAAGVDRERGLAYAGILWQPSEDFHVGASAGVVPDLFMGVYSEGAYGRALTDEVGLRLDGQFTYQQSVGQELVPGAPFATWNIGVRASTSWQGAMLRLGFSITGDDSPIRSPYGSNPSYVSLMQRTFNQAGEKALLASLSYDFSEVGFQGLTALFVFVQGWDGRVLGVRGDAREVDVTVDYRLPKELGLFEGLWLRLRGAWLEEEQFDKDGTDFRVILRYDFPVI